MAKLVFVPGLLCTDALFQPQIDALSASHSIHIAQTTDCETIDQMVEYMLDSVSGEIIVIGLSMGGYVAQEAARIAPDRISAIALLSTSAQPDDEARKRQRHELIKLSEIGRFKGVTPRLLPRFLSAEALEDEAMCQTVMDMAAEIGQKHFTSQQYAIMARRDQRPYLPSFHKPSLVLCGMADELTPPQLSEEMAGLLPRAELVLLDKIGHLSSLEAPEEVTQAIIRLIIRAEAG
ncbi:MAG: alpha/beta fold hydrolase [Candidatus Puniceispirillaceae bacterium]|jgi:pimeloyl-ACP methyl ester carboxylesterase